MKVLALTNMYPTLEAPYLGVFVRNTVESLRRADPSLRIDVLFVHGRRSRLRYLIAPLRVLARATGRYDLIHVHYGLLAGPGALFPGPRVITLYGSDVNDPRQLRWARPFLGRYDAAVVMNEEMRRRIGRPDARILPPGIDLRRFAPKDRREARKRLGLDPEASYVLFPSRSDRPEKRFDLFTDVLGRVGKLHPGVRPLILGEPPRPDAEIPWVYAASDVLLLTSATEGSPTVVKEALAMGLPVVSVDVGDVSTLVQGVRGVHVVPGRDAEALAAAVGKALEHRDGCDGAQTAGRFSIEGTARSLLEIYSQVAGRR